MALTEINEVANRLRHYRVSAKIFA